MKKYLFLILTFTSTTICGKSQECDYIESSYYQLIYEADIAYMLGNKDTAFSKIAEAEKLCPLIECPLYYEMSKYVELLTAAGDYSKALKYIEILVKNYGYEVSSFEKKDYMAALKPHINWDSLSNVLTADLNSYYIANASIVEELKQITVDDQAVRNKKVYSAEDLQRMDSIDNVNSNRIKELVNQHGFVGFRLLGQRNMRLLGSLNALFMHFSDTCYYKPLLLHYIKKGECSPLLLGQLIDSNERTSPNAEKYTYGIYLNAKKQVKNKDRLDERRRSIGMPPLHIERQRDSLQSILYGFEFNKENYELY